MYETIEPGLGRSLGQVHKELADLQIAAECQLKLPRILIEPRNPRLQGCMQKLQRVSTNGHGEKLIPVPCVVIFQRFPWPFGAYWRELYRLSEAATAVAAQEFLELARGARSLIDVQRSRRLKSRWFKDSVQTLKDRGGFVGPTDSLLTRLKTFKTPNLCESILATSLH